MGTSLKKKKVTLNLDAEPGKTIYVAGDFNDWIVDDPKSKKVRLLKEGKSEGSYTINMFLSTGEHEYKFYSENEWFVDPKAEVNKQNPYGTFNSIIEVS